jgi:predicted acetyltransferase
MDIRAKKAMPMIIPATRKQRDVLRNLFDLYAYDFSEMTATDVEPSGRYTPDDFLTGFWDHAIFHPFLLSEEGHWAGFAFVERGSYITPGFNQHWLMEEFFVVRKYRRRGLGTWFARELLTRFPGIWEIGQIPENKAATQFWRRTLRLAVKGEFDEVTVSNERWEGLVQRFEVK